MNISSFFIDRPIFAGVLSIVIFIVGLLSIRVLPISEYPEVVPPSVVVTASFPGANPKILLETIATPLEEQINGVENMLYMYSQGTSDGSLKLTVTFKIGTDPDLAQQLVQNRVNQALPRLPDITRQIGVTILKSSPDLTMVVHLISPNNHYDMLYLRNYALLNVKDQISRIPGIGSVRLFGSGDYAMRIWINPQKAAERNITATDIMNAIKEQNVPVAAGIVGGAPTAAHVDIQLQVNTPGRLITEEEFGQIIIKSTNDGAIVRLKDIARIEMGASEYTLSSYLDNKQAAAIPIFQSPGANAIEISDNVRDLMKDLKHNFPEGMDYKIVYDPTVFVRDSIKAVIHTLFEAVILVLIVVILFLQTWRASIIPLMAVPVSVVGTFGVLHLLGFSINSLTLFGLVLAIGIVVDDAIVVVENVERNIEEGLSPREATYKAMQEVSGPIIAIALTLCAVFIPICFIGGLTGQFYKQFAATISISTIISAVNSLTLSPALSALLLKAPTAKKDILTRGMDKIFGGFFKRFNRVFHKTSDHYSKKVSLILGHKSKAFGVYIILIILTYISFHSVPSGFVPSQDKQYLISFAQLPDGSTLSKTESVLNTMSKMIMDEPGVDSAVSFPGLSINGFTNSSSAGIIFASLKSFDARQSPDLSAGAIAGKLNAKFANIKEAFTAIFPPPPVQGIGTIGGFKLQIEDRSDSGYEALDQVIKNITQKAYQNPMLKDVFSNYKINVPQLNATLDRTKAKQLGLSIADIFTTMQLYLGSYYINDFNTFGRTYQVIAQADAEFRAKPRDILLLKTRNAKGDMVPFGTVLTIAPGYGPESAMHYNGYRSADINGAPTPGFSSGQAQEAMANIVKETLPKGMDFEWTDLAYQEILAGNTAIIVFPICILFVFLVLSALYESLILPLSIILIVPMCLLFAMTGVWLTRGDNNILTQISLFVLVGLACKNAILIVEFAHDLERAGYKTVEAAIKACQLRLRPIIMTSFAFIMGVIPLVMSTGAGSEMRKAMGIAVFSGMLGVTFFGLLLTPLFYVMLRKFEDRFKKVI